MNKLYKKYIKTDMLPTLFCPGCGNGIIQYAAISAIDELGAKEDIACVSGIGCSSWIPCYLKLDVIHAMHGRALPTATGLKLVRPDKKILVFTGDGDCLAIGGNHFLHAAARNIDLTVIMVNNYIYGMTGGQKSPATPQGAVTKTSQLGAMETPLKAAELAVAMGASHVARWTVAHPVQLSRTIKTALAHGGFSFIEVLCQCPTQAGKSVYGEKDPAKIMEGYKKNTCQLDATKANAEGKLPIGTLKHDKTAKEYTARINEKLQLSGGVSCPT